jgi:hypothetical protein
MRRSLVVLAVVTALCLLAIRPWSASARAMPTPTATTNAATCVVNNYTLNGTFNRVGGNASFTLDASGGCFGTSSGVTVNLAFSSLGPWSCVAGVAQGSGGFQPNNGGFHTVAAALVNTGGEYVVQLYSLTGAATGEFTTLPIPCVEGQTQTTIGGTGTLTFAG